MTRDDEKTERRLQYEAGTVRLGRLGVPDEDTTDTARVEVSWVDEYGEQHAGYFSVNVHVPTDVDWDAPDALDHHPAQLASEAVHHELTRRGEARGWDYWNVDDVYAD